MGYITPAFSGVQKRAELLCNPCVLRGHQSKGDKIGIGYIPLPSRGPERGWNWHATLAFSGVRNRKGTKSKSATPPLPSRGAELLRSWGSLQ